MKTVIPHRSIEIETASQEALPSVPLPPPPGRPARIAPWLLAVLSAALALSLVSGIALWWGMGRLADPEAGVAGWLRAAAVTHGVLNPVLTLLFGFLWGHHMRTGWEKRSQRASGLSMTMVFAGLILTGVGLYYGSEQVRAISSLLHRGLGVLLPLLLAGHWIQAARSAKKL